MDGIVQSKMSFNFGNKFPLSGNAKRFKARKGKKDFMQEEDKIITSEIKPHDI
jgi:hypothetical protein